MTAVFEFRNGSVVRRTVKVSGPAELLGYVKKAVRWVDEHVDRTAYVYAFGGDGERGYRSRSVDKMLEDLSVPF